MSLLKKLNNSISDIFSTLFGVGYIPFAPGTFGTIVTFLIWIVLPDYWFYNPVNKVIYIPGQFLFLLTIFILYFFGVFVTTITEYKLGHDSPKIIFDELLGFLISVIFLPKTMVIAFYALILFRVFDIAKPFPINKIQKLPAGFGIMSDDVLAGIYTNILIQILIRIFPKFFY